MEGHEREIGVHWRQESSLCKGTEVWEGSLVFGGSRVRADLKAGGVDRDQLRGLHPRGLGVAWPWDPTTDGIGMMQRRIRAKEARVQVPPAPALPHGFEADIPPASQSLSALPCACTWSDQPLGLRIPSGPESLQGLSHLCTATIKLAFPKHLPCDHRDQTLSSWYGYHLELGGETSWPQHSWVAYPGTFLSG